MTIDIKGIDHVVLRVTDLPRMLAFYCDVLGCREERRLDEIGLVQLRAGASLIDLVPVDGQLGRAGGAAPGTKGRNMDHFALRIATFDPAALNAHLTAHGIAPGEPATRYGAEGDGPSLYLQDPEGNTVELKGPPHAAAASQAASPPLPDVHTTFISRPRRSDFSGRPSPRDRNRRVSLV